MIGSAFTALITGTLGHSSMEQKLPSLMSPCDIIVEGQVRIGQSLSEYSHPIPKLFQVAAVKTETNRASVSEIVRPNIGSIGGFTIVTFGRLSLVIASETEQRLEKNLSACLEIYYYLDLSGFGHRREPFGSPGFRECDPARDEYESHL
jgi:hypothetical protein